MKTKYVQIPGSEINKETYSQAHRILAYCRKEYKMPMVTLNWFLPAASKSAAFHHEERVYFDSISSTLAGKVSAGCTNEIWIRGHRAAAETMETVAHEVQHLIQNMKPEKDEHLYNPCIALSQEEEADRFARWAIQNYKVDDEAYLDHLAGKDFTNAKTQTKAVNISSIQENLKILGGNAMGANAELIKTAENPKASMTEIKAAKQQASEAGERFEILKDTYDSIKAARW